MSSRLALLLTAALGGCGNPTYGQCSVACGPSLSCPGEMRCLADLFCHPAGEGAICEATGGDGAGAGDGNTGGVDGQIMVRDGAPLGDDGPPIPNPCPAGWVPGPYTTFFEGTSIPSWAAIEKPASMDVTVSDGKLTFDLYGGGAAYASFYVNGLIDCHDRLLRVHLVEVPRIGDHTEAVIDWYQDMNNSVHVGVSYGDLQWITWINGNQNWIGEPFSGSEMYWGLREEAGMLYFEVSADGTSWRELHRMSSPALLSSCSPGVGSGTDGPISNPGQTVADEFLDCVKD